MVKKHKNTLFHDLFVDQLSDLYEAEKQMGRALPTILNAVSDEDFREDLSKHLKETRKQGERLEKVFKILGEEPRRVRSFGMEGLLRDCNDVIQRNEPSIVEDAVLIGALQKIEHYEIAAYGTLKTFAEHLGYDEIKDLLQKSLEEEGKANNKLTSLAEGSWFTTGINQTALKK